MEPSERADDIHVDGEKHLHNVGPHLPLDHALPKGSPDQELSELSQKMAAVGVDMVKDAKSMEKSTRGKIGDVLRHLPSIREIFRKLNPQVADILLWNSPLRTVFVLCSSLVVLYILFYSRFTLVSIFCYTFILGIVLNFVYVTTLMLLANFQHVDVVSPKKESLRRPPHVTEERGRMVVEKGLSVVNSLITHISNILFMDNKRKTLQALFLLYLGTIVGQWATLRTWILLSILVAFSIPKVIDMYEGEIHQSIHFLFHVLGAQAHAFTMTMSGMMRDLHARMQKSKQA